MHQKYSYMEITTDSVVPTRRGPQRPPLRYQGRSHLWPNVAIYNLFLGIFSGSNAKIQKEIWKFKWDFKNSKFCEIEILHHIDKQKIAKTRFILNIQDWNFLCRPSFNSITNHVLQLRLSDQFSKFSFF